MKLRIDVLTSLNPRGPLSKTVELECEGSGTEQDPAIITTSEHLPDGFRIYDSNLFINIVNCELSHIIMGNCRNISLNNCKIRYIGFGSFVKMRIKNSNFKKSHILSSRELEFDTCSFMKLKIFRSSYLGFTKCSFVKLIDIENTEVFFKESSIQELKEKDRTQEMMIYTGGLILTVVGLIVIILFPDLIFFGLVLIVYWIMVFLFTHRKKRSPSENQEFINTN